MTDVILLGKAADQFTKNKPTSTRNIVGVTGFAEPSDLFASLCEAELAKHDHIQAILYRTLLGPVYIFTRYEGVLHQLLPLFAPTRPDDLPRFYSVPFDRTRRDERVALRAGKPATPTKSGSIWYGVIGSLPSKVQLNLPPVPYHMKIEKYLDGGEPIFQVVTKYLYPSASTGNG